jgi:branched-chain amino acid transport system substrate-binding protein
MRELPFRSMRVAGVAGALLICTASFGFADDRPIDVNAILSLTGQAAFIGTTYQKTLQALESSVNKRGGIRGQPLHFVIADDQSNPANAVQLANGLLAKNVNVFLGPNLTATCRAVEPLTVNGPTVYCLSPSVHPPKGAFMFSVGVDTHDQAADVIRFFRTRGWHDLGMIISTDASGQDAEAMFNEALKQPENHEMRFVAIEHFNVTDTSVSAQLIKIQAARPQAIIAWSTGTPMGTTMRGLQETGIDLPVLMSNANALTPAMKAFAGILPPQLYSFGPQYMLPTAANANNVERNYFGALKSAGVDSDYIAGLSWDPASIVVDALRQVGPNASASQIRDYILRLHDYHGIAGSFDFTDGSQRGLGQQNMLIMRWDAAKAVWVAVSKLGGAVR